MVNQPLVKKGMGVASKEKCLYWLQNISKWIETNKSKRNYFICKREGSAIVMSLQIIMMFQWGLTLLNY
jgi:hypothetical protein